MNRQRRSGVFTWVGVVCMSLKHLSSFKRLKMIIRKQLVVVVVVVVVVLRPR